MIAYLSGKLVSKEPFQLVIEAAGVGYEILCTQEAYNRAPSAGSPYNIHTRLIVREDSQTLYGFSTPEERRLFDLVITVSGIGPKTGLTVVSALGTETLKEAIRSGDLIALKGIPGIGKKTAERLVVELRDKLLKEEPVSEVMLTSGDKNVRTRQEALSALVALGYNRADAEKAIRSVLRDDPDMAKKVETLVKASLRSF
jgi:Holliday junction DNA helicase RuvA